MSLKRAPDLVVIGLEGFAVKEMTQIFYADGEGKIGESLGFLEDSDLAEGYVAAHKDASILRRRLCSILTDGKVGFLLNVDPVFLMNADGARRMVADKAVAKLTPLELKLVREQ